MTTLNRIVLTQLRTILKPAKSTGRLLCSQRQSKLISIRKKIGGLIAYFSGEKEAQTTTISRVSTIPPIPERNHSAVKRSGNIFTSIGRNCL